MLLVMPISESFGFKPVTLCDRKRDPGYQGRYAAADKPVSGQH